MAKFEFNDVFEDYGYGKVVYNLADKRYEVLGNDI